MTPTESVNFDDTDKDAFGQTLHFLEKANMISIIAFLMYCKNLYSQMLQDYLNYLLQKALNVI